MMTDSKANDQCEQARSYYYDLLCPQESSEPVPGRIAIHIEGCSRCQKEIQGLKSALLDTDRPRANRKQVRAELDMLLEQHFRLMGEPVTCKKVRTFLPSLARSDLEIRIPTPITVHLEHCPQCRSSLEAIRHLNLSSTQLKTLSKLFAGEISSHEDTQGLCESVSDLLKQPESGVTTLYKITRSAEPAATPQFEYGNLNILVEVKLPNAAPKVYPTFNMPEKVFLSEQSIRANRLKLFFKAGLATAILIVASVLFFNNWAGTRPVSLEKVYKAVIAAANVHVTISTPGPTDFTVEKWLSRTRQTCVVRNEEGTTLWDLANKRITPYASTKLNAAAGAGFTAIAREMAGTLGIAPFSSLSDIPADAKWQPVITEGPRKPGDGIQAYELQWTQKAPTGGLNFRKWLVFIDLRTNLPVKSEFYIKSMPEADYTLESVQIIRYLDEKQMQDVLDGFSR